MLRNLKIGRAVLNARITKHNRLLLLIDTKDSCTVRALEYDTQKPIGGFKIDGSTQDRFAYGVIDDAIFAIRSNQIETYLLENYQLTYSCNIKPYLGDVTAFKPSTNGYYVAVGDSSGKVAIFNPKIDAPKRIVENLSSAVVSLVFDKDNKNLAIATDLGDVRIIDIGDSEVSFDLICGKRASKMHFSDRYLLVGDKDGYIRLFDRSGYNEEKIKNLECNEIVFLESCFDGKGAIAVSASGRIYVVSLVDLNREPILIDVCGDEIYGAAYDDGTKHFVVYSATGNIYYHNLSLDRELLHLFSSNEKPKEAEPKQTKQHIKVISVDDSVTMRRVIVSAVKNCTKNVITFEANDGKEAMAVLKENPDMDIMFLDWNMPTMSGEEVAKAIKDTGVYPNLQIIMATTEGGKDKVVKMLRLGVAGYLVKPFRPDAITKIMAKLSEVVGR